jgi:hypothetical protein
MCLWVGLVFQPFYADGFPDFSEINWKGSLNNARRI